MCFVLLQIYGCGHTKPICTTACPHALRRCPNPFHDSNIPTPGTPSSPVHMALDKQVRTPTSPYHSSTPSPVSPQQSLYRNQLVTLHVGEEGERTPNYCPISRQQYRYLCQSKYPCLVCYMQPQWASYRQRWCQDYRAMHPNTKTEDVEVSPPGPKWAFLQSAQDMFCACKNTPPYFILLYERS